ncbi:MAG: DUF4252 domain-containing protein [Flavobacteriales bacterium]|nr:DUF4252 domain-containing protein [Flavobacteriales bacterium]
MKKYMMALFLGLIGTASFAQQNAMDRYFGQYAANDDYSHVTITGKMFEMMTHVEVQTEEEQEIKDALEGIAGIEIVMSDSVEIARAEYTKAINLIKSPFESLMTIDDKDAKVEFFINEKNGVVTELLIIGNIDEGFGIVDIWGNIDLKSIHNITQKMEVMGMEKYDGDKAEIARSLNFYPNPITVGKDGNFDITDAALGTELRVMDLNGRILSSTTITSNKMSVPLSKLSTGTYLVSIYDGDTRLFNEKVIVTR